MLVDGLVRIVGAGPYSLLLGLFMLTAALGQPISNMATALVVVVLAPGVVTAAVAGLVALFGILAVLIVPVFWLVLSNV